ncbi:hypothetical protein [Pyxidicoccus xibeiensis]|uniref:hypothetical protein n=1 Tax=Pyxidicoccus xibeiensis TaxID=2906759 RepID=UPI0020A831A1|nr:hypothetical protein [Pyxidicoccus xibeiensis]MCP3139495.1 hypothetical protein [Pyxidicoccus xibeiensis]
MLAPFLESASPAGFVALQRGVDMPRLVESLKDWDAVRLGALGPLRTEAAQVLHRKRAAFLVTATEKYGAARAEVFALFVLHTAFDEDVRQLLRLLAGDKRLAQTLGEMGSVREELRRRGLPLSELADREERAGDVARGLGRAARDALASSPLSEGARYQDFSAKVVQLPVPYQEALHEVEKALMRQHFEPGSVVVGGFDSLTFGVPVGFYHLVAGTGQGVSSLARGRYEQATRELAPSALLVALYAGGRGARAVTGSRGTGPRVQVPGLHLEGLKEVAERLAGRLGGEGVRELARYLQASREAAFLVCEGGEAAAVALHEARGNVARAQAWLSEAKPPRAGPATAGAGVAKSAGGVAALVREAAGFTREAVEARLRQAEQEAPGARLTADVAVLEARRPRVEAPPRGAQGSPLWGEYVAYWEGRVAELKQGRAAKPPLTWEGYQPMRGLFARGLDFERRMAARLREDAALPRGQRQWLKDFHAPRVETHVGVAKEGAAGVRYTDVLVIDESPPAGQPPRVETFSFKSRDLSLLKQADLASQLIADSRAALRYYGETLDLRRRSLRPDGKPVQVQVQRVRLIYEGGPLVPSAPNAFAAAVEEARRKVRGVEVLVQ